MKITWLGHAAFLLETTEGTRVILDPYRPGSYDGAIAYGPINETADVVIVTHTHDDHDGVELIPGDPLILVEPRHEHFGSLEITGIPVFHDTEDGSQRGENTILVLEQGGEEGLRLVHLGDLGHELDRHLADAIGPADILLIPVGGLFTIDANAAARVVNSLSPRVIIPMHYKTARCGFQLAPVDDFLATQARVQRLETSTVVLELGGLPNEPTVMVLKPAH